MLQKNSIHEIRVTDQNNLGFGVGRVDGMVVFIGGAVDGDLVRARIIRTASGYAVARVEELLEASPYRIEPLCSAAGCGGCAYRAVSPAHEAALKTARVRDAFRKHGLADVEILPLLAGEKRYGYRNKAQYPVAEDRDGNIKIGFYAPKSHRVVEAAACPLGDPRFAPVLETVRRLAKEYGIRPYREEDGSGLLRHIYLRGDSAGRELILTLVINRSALPKETAIVEELRRAHPSLVGILVNINRADTNVICGEEYRVLFGRDHMKDILCGVRLRITPASFYQVNHEATELLYRRAAELADLHGDELLLDLYCGIGSIGLSMAGRVRELVGIEIVESAVECARQNAADNGIGNASFFCGDAGDAEKLLATAETARGAAIRPDVVILDPPRKGSTPELLSYVARLAPSRIVYISCNPDTLARDAVILRDLGYRMGAVTPVDLFPGTGHVESVVRFDRENTEKESV